MKTLKRYFVTGFFTVIPLGLSLGVVFWIVRAADASLAPVADAALGFHVPGLGLVVALAAVFGAGVLASNWAGERLLEAFEHLLERIPVFKGVYSTVKQMTEAFSPHNKTSFKSVVVVEFPRPGVYSLGFATSETRLDLPGGHKDLVAVYIPTNHVYIGDTILVPRDQVHPTRITVQQGIQIALSAGSGLPESLTVRKGS